MLSLPQFLFYIFSLPSLPSLPPSSLHLSPSPSSLSSLPLSPYPSSLLLPSLLSADVMSESHETVVQLLQYLLQRGKKDRTTEGAGESGSEYEAVIAECGRCLGELGCVDLKQVALPEPSRSNDCTGEGPCLVNTVDESSDSLLFHLLDLGRGTTHSF